MSLSRDLVPLGILENNLLPYFPFDMTASLPSPQPSPPAPRDPADAEQQAPSPAASTSNASPASPPAASARKSPQPSAEPPVQHKCLWQDCTLAFADPEVLYNHLCNDHIGRKSTNNLCLTCRWKDCGTSCAKRDHITSHLRVHTPLKPHACEVCKKSFKRPQDLKKHEKIHTEEHHQQHKHSKAITVVDPAYVQRVRGPSSAAADKAPSVKPVSANGSLKVPVGRGKPNSEGPFGLLPTPSPELGHPPIHSHHASHDMFMANQSLPSWEVLRSDAAIPTGSKRSHDYSVDEFFTDMKKRRVNPSYDPRMAERLDTLAYAQQHSNNSPPYSSNTFNPRSVSLDIRTPEELAAVNEFLLTLGRDVSSNIRPLPVSHSNNSNSSLADHYFDATHLSQLGLAGMPGLAGGSGYPRSHPVVQTGQYGGMYSGINDAVNSYSPPSDYGRRPSAKYPQTNTNFSHYHHHPTPPLESSSPHSTVSTPVNTTPPQVPLAMPDTFDYMRGPRGAPPVAHLAPPDYVSKAMRPIIPLKTAPGSYDHSAASARAAPMEPKLSLPTHRGPPANLAQISKPGSLYPLLTSGDAEFKLPPLSQLYRSSSPPSTRESTPSSTHSSPPTRANHLPGLLSVASSSGGHAQESEELSKELGRIELEHRSSSRGDREITQDERKRHADTILNLLVSINADFKRKYPDRYTNAAVNAESPCLDVEMAAA
ncbi:hypothetical protein EST38_g3291 [Candolleomyces aberdarensis]|uniref:C2H2-type domain-containing protein n=1 Tax=Candolleomyces aberdarensis TaxID=2316362 RepID=A0A4Q2DR79_9AGAR|nr:hypothetical protein EST38_g3291 [Candolleomyces aberdarensis]